MEYGLRRYEAAQRLMWFLFFLLCLVVARWIAQSQPAVPDGFLSLAPSLQFETLKSLSFWFQLRWLNIEPLGYFIVYGIWVALLFVGGHALWLLVQFAGTCWVRHLLTTNIKQARNTSDSAARNPALLPANAQRWLPAELLLRKVGPLPLQLILHPVQRLRLMLTNPQGTISSEELIEKERRLAEADWQILWSSWTPLRWLLWLLPVLGLLQVGWLLYRQVQPALSALSGQREIPDIVVPAVLSLLPLVQVVIITVALHLASGLLKRLESLYLSSLDALLYDQLLSRLPYQSSDTLILLEALQRHFQELHSALERVEHALGAEKNLTDNEVKS